MTGRRMPLPQLPGESREAWDARNLAYLGPAAFAETYFGHRAELAAPAARPEPEPGRLWQPPAAAWPKTQAEMNEDQIKLGVARALAAREVPRRIAAMDAAAFAAVGQDDGDDDGDSFTVLGADDLRDLEAVPDLVDGMVGPPGTLNMINGYRGSMKSLTALGLAAAVGGGMSTVYGLSISGQTPVLYAYLEGATGLPRRVNAWEAHHGLTMDGVHFIHGALDLKQPDDVRRLARLAKRLGAGLVVLDSVQKSGGGREDAEDFSAYRSGLEALRDATGAAVLALHNSGHDRTRARGHTTLVDGVDSAVVLIPRAATDGGGTSVRDEKSRDTPALDDLQLMFEEAGPLNPATGKAWSGVVVRQSVLDSLHIATTATIENEGRAIAAIEAAGGSISPKALRDILKMGEKPFGTLMAGLVADGRVGDNGLRTQAKRYLRVAS